MYCKSYIFPILTCSYYDFTNYSNITIGTTNFIKDYDDIE